MELTYRKTKEGKREVFGPAAAIAAGRTVTVTKKDGSTKTETIGSVGKTFEVNGTVCVYGYPAPKSEPRHAGAPRPHSGRCRGDGCRNPATLNASYQRAGNGYCGFCLYDEM